MSGKGNQGGNASRSEGGVMGCSTPHCGGCGGEGVVYSVECRADNALNYNWQLAAFPILWQLIKQLVNGALNP